MKDTDLSLQLFLRGFTARDIAGPLASFDETASASAIRAAMDKQNLEFVGICRDGNIAGWMTREDVSQDGAEWRRIEGADFISETTSLNEVVQALDSTQCLFVRSSAGPIGGMICRRDLQKPAMRMWLFGLVTITELRVTSMIDEFCPEDSWRQYLSEGRLLKAHDLQDERRHRGQQRSLLDCLQFADKGRIVARDERLRERTRFASKREVENFVVSLQDLRNNLAHSQDISDDWEIIRDLATNLHRIVLGPVSKSPSVDE